MQTYPVVFVGRISKTRLEWIAANKNLPDMNAAARRSTGGGPPPATPAGRSIGIGPAAWWPTGDITRGMAGRGGARGGRQLRSAAGARPGQRANERRGIGHGQRHVLCTSATAPRSAWPPLSRSMDGSTPAATASAESTRDKGHGATTYTHPDPVTCRRQQCRDLASAGRCLAVPSRLAPLRSPSFHPPFLPGLAAGPWTHAVLRCG